MLAAEDFLRQDLLSQDREGSSLHFTKEKGEVTCSGQAGLSGPCLSGCSLSQVKGSDRHSHIPVTTAARVAPGALLPFQAPWASLLLAFLSSSGLWVPSA